MLDLWSWLSTSLQENSEVLRFILIGSVVFFIAALVFVPLIASKIPTDYFNAEEKKAYAPKNIFLYLLYKILKNILGLVMLLLGVVLLFTPGQGLLCILLASLLMDYPGKFRFQRFLIQKKPVLESLNWLRKIAGVGPLEV